MQMNQNNINNHQLKPFGQQTLNILVKNSPRNAGIKGRKLSFGIFGYCKANDTLHENRQLQSTAPDTVTSLSTHFRPPSFQTPTGQI